MRSLLQILVYFSYLAAIIFAADFSHGEVLTLDQAVGQAQSQSPEILEARAKSDAAHWRKVEAWGSIAPTVTASANYLLDKKYVFTDVNFAGNPVSFPGIVPTTTYALDARLGLFDGFASTNRRYAAGAHERAAKNELKWTEFKVSREIALEYYRAAATKKLREVAEANSKVLQDHLKDVRLTRRSGLSTNFDVLRVEVQVSEADSALVNAEDDIAVASAHLGEMLGRDGPIETIGELPVLGPELVAGIRPDQAPNRADLQALEDDVQSLEFQRRATTRHLIPKLSAYGTYNYYNNINDEYDDWGRFRNAYQVGLTLQWNLFDGFQSTARSGAAAAEHRQLEVALQRRQQKARNDLQVWTRKYKYYCSVYKARQANIGRAKEAVRLAREGRKVGARTTTEFLDAEAELYRTQAEAIRAQLGSIEALIQVELSTGQKLYAFK